VSLHDLKSFKKVMKNHSEEYGETKEALPLEGEII
jgi:hypothetical protein